MVGGSEGLPILGGLFSGRGLVVGTIQAQFGIAKGRINERAVMRAGGIVVLIGSEEAAGHAHAGDRDAALLLKRADHCNQCTQESGLFGSRKLADGL